MLNTYLTLLIAHFIGDFPLQSGKIYNLKIKSNSGLSLHVLIHIIVSMLLIKDPFHWWWVLVLLAIIHFGIDWVKLRINTSPMWRGYIADQLVHWTSLLSLVLLAPEMDSALPAHWLMLDFNLVLIPVVTMLVWIVLTDEYPGHHTIPRRMVWFKIYGLKVSKSVGVTITVFIALQRIGIL